MALADNSPAKPSRRLDSWKEIAEYIGRDVRTATRWETQGMPLHRVPGGRGASVFAFTHEIDQWMAGPRTAAAAEPAPPPIVRSGHAPRRRFRPRGVVLAATGALALAAAVYAFRVKSSANSSGAFRVIATSSELSLADGSATRVIYRFQPDHALLISGPSTRLTDLNHDGIPEIAAGISFFADAAGSMTRGGELLTLDAAGTVRWRFAFNDVLTFRDGAMRGPWALSDWQSTAAAPGARIAVAAHDYTWWASMVSVIDDAGRRHGTFVNPGWIESLAWLGANRLTAAGFSNARNEAMVALLDADSPDGQAPDTAGTPFECVSCPAGRPLFYATFPRSELNLATGSPFNRARVALVGDRIIVTTTEADPQTATAIYEFDRNMQFVRARYSEAYWDTHGRLEREGRLTHTRANCPEREGPPVIHVWDSAAGRWQATR